MKNFEKLFEKCENTYEQIFFDDLSSFENIETVKLCIQNEFYTILLNRTTRHAVLVNNICVPEKNQNSIICSRAILKQFDTNLSFQQGRKICTEFF